MNRYFLDTGYVLALELANDQNHQRVSTHWRQIVSLSPRLVTTSFVFNEVVTFLNSRGYHEKAVEVGDRIFGSESVEFIHLDVNLFAAAWQYLKRYKDKRYSLTDCASFVVMERRGLTLALSTDRHFEQAGKRTGTQLVSSPCRRGAGVGRAEARPTCFSTPDPRPPTPNPRQNSRLTLIPG